jgi:hypothetical protein
MGYFGDTLSTPETPESVQQSPETDFVSLLPERDTTLCHLSLPTSGHAEPMCSKSPLHITTEYIGMLITFPRDTLACASTSYFSSLAFDEARLTKYSIV